MHYFAFIAVVPGSERTLLKPGEVASMLAVSRTWVYEAAQRGRIPAIRVGGPDGPLRFVAEDLERWLAEARGKWLPGQSATATEMTPRHGQAPDVARAIASSVAIAPAARIRRSRWP